MGKIILESDGDSLTVLKFNCHRFYKEEKITMNNELYIFIKTKIWLDKYFKKGENLSIKELKFSQNGNEFRQKEARYKKCNF